MRRLAIVLVLLAVVTAGFFALVYAPTQRRAIRASWAHELVSHADVYQAGVEIWVADRLADALTVASYPSVVAASGGEDHDHATEHLAAILVGFAKNQGFDQILVHRSDGETLSMNGDDAAEQVDAVCIAVAQQSIANGETSVDLHRHASGSIAVAFVAPVRSAGSSRPIAAVVLETAPDRWLYPFFASKSPKGRNPEALLATRDGESARYLTPLTGDAAPPLETRRALSIPGLSVERALQGGSTIGSGVDYRGEPVLAVTRPIRGTLWALVVKIDEAVIAREARARLLRDGAVLVLTLVGIGALVVVIVSAKDRQTRRANERLAAVMQYANDAILFINREGRIEEANRRAEKMYGRSRQELCSLGISELRNANEGPSEVDELARIESSGHRGFRTNHRDAGGTVFPVEISSRLVEIQGVKGVIAIIRDVSEVVAVEKELQRLNEELETRVIQRTTQLADANRELEAFSYSVSHDLRAPLRAIDGFSRILAEDHGTRLDDEGRRLLGVVRSSAQRMGRLIDDLLEFSRAGRRDIRKQRTDMSALVRVIVGELAAASQVAATRFTIGELPSASCDATLVRQVWDNLLSNAVKFSSKNPTGVIEVGSLREGGRTIYFVRDHGVGFDMKYAGKLFGVFQRLHSQSDFEGTGVGLALVQRIVRRHGGDSWAEGELERGATFYFSLPDDDTSMPPP